MTTKAEKLKRESKLRLTAAETLEQLEQLRPDFWWNINNHSLTYGDLDISGRTTGETDDGWVGYELSFGVTNTPPDEEFAVSCFLRAEPVEAYRTEVFDHPINPDWVCVRFQRHETAGVSCVPRPEQSK